MPLERKTPLKRTPFKKKIKEQNPSLKREGPRTLRWKSWRNQNRQKAISRSKNRCEFHVDGSCQSIPEWNHCFGRGTWSISEPWASFYPLTVMVCKEAHLLFHTQIRVRRLMQREALSRFFTTEPFNKFINWNEIHERYMTWEPHEILRDIIRQLEQKGVSPDAIGNPPTEGRQSPN